MSRLLLKNAAIVTGATSFKGSLGVDGGRISGIWEGVPSLAGVREIDLEGKILMAGAIDTHVHFREPGLTHKADIGSESAAAVLGGVTSFIDMPNTAPPTVNLATLEDKLRRAGETSLANYGFHIGATNENAAQIREYIGLGARFAGVKVFMGSSTGNMLVDREGALDDLFKIKGKTILTHCEDESIVKANLKRAESIYGEEIPFSEHSRIRSREACVKSTGKALDLALRHGTRLHILHVSTAEEVEMIREAKLRNPGITAETSANYLWFSDEDYDRMGGRLKCNPSVKTAADREALIKALEEGVIDSIGSDHAPHLPEEKARPYLGCPSGLPTIQHSLPAALTISLNRGIPLSRLASAFSEMPATIFGIEDRGFLREGYHADLVVLDPNREYTAGPPASKCGWSPYEGLKFKGSVDMVWVNGSLAAADGKIVEGRKYSRPLLYKS
ncbi:MAG: dihydroorotase [Bacteroidales bacterium]|nr:dihydroorotase [Bacteroidales bacterium]